MLQLSERDQQQLLRIVRNAVASELSRTLPSPVHISSGVLSEHHGVFVSIHKGRNLRGCIGNIHSNLPLYRAAADCAVSAAIADPRFPALSPDELSSVTFEISVLSSMEPVKNIKDIVLGTHGLHVQKGRARGLLLPQVASSHGWDHFRFLHEVCQKAGLSPDDLEESTIERFSAVVFAEHSYQPVPTS
jgi:AmmeMemoRadiSam system protein A